MKQSKFEVPADKLIQRCDPKVFNFECTKDLAPLREFIGQERAIRAIQFGLNMKNRGYNIYVSGLTGTGKTSMVKTYINKLIEKRQAEKPYHPDDWCYLHNFADTDRPQIVNLPQGKGKTFRDQLNNLLEKLKEELRKAFSSDEYKTQRKRMVEEGQSAQQTLFAEIGEEARQQGFLLQMTPMGPVLVPLVNGKPLTEEDYMKLKEPARKELDNKRAELLKKLQAAFEKAHELEHTTVEKVQNTDKAVADYVVSRLFASLLKEYIKSENISKYLNDLKEYTINNLDIFKESEQAQQPSVFGIPANVIQRGGDPFLPFKVNVFVDNSENKGPPVIIESNPIYTNMFGKMERRFLFGGYISDHTMLKPGAFHLANGGYLLLSAQDVLINPAVWPTLKRCIKNKEVRIEEPFEQMGLFVSMGMRPQPMPIEVKVVLIGDPMIYQLLSIYDEDFWEIFRVKADFDWEIDRTKDNMYGFAAFIAGCCEECEIRHFDATGVARVIDYSSRFVSDQEKMSSRFAQIKELVEEAEHWAAEENVEHVAARHVDRAIEEKLFRHNLPDEKLKEMITRDFIMIDVEGAVPGQVNGLAVYSLGDVTFGKPSRITCKTFLGRGGVINIERESQMSGKIHDKGVLILSGYMGWKYAQDHPLSLSASLCFEQSYEGVEGDSASSTELYALLSSLSDLPINQSIAVTGSVNQKGEIQPIGGVNQKIEGFFQVCKAKGLTGEQGVMIPQKNLKNLMLRQEVVDAVKDGKFHIYAVSTIDEGIEVLTNVPAGERGKDGTYPLDTVNYRVSKQLKEMAEKLKQFHAPEEEGKEEQKKKREKT